MHMKLAVLFSLVALSLAQLSMLQRLKTAKTLDEFLAMVQKDGHPMRPEDVYPHAATNTSTGEKQYISGGLVLASPDECSPRPMTVEIPRHVNDTANTVYWPECTRVLRCGGCCPSAKLECVADDVETVTLHVLKAIAREQGSLNLDWVGPLAVAIPIHTSCRLMCRLTVYDCYSYQRFVPEECSCVCYNQYACNPNKRWNSETCSCRCRGERTCSRNTVYDDNQCKCVILEEAQEANIAVSDNLSQAEIDAYVLANNAELPVAPLGNDHQLNNGFVETAPPTPTTTTTTTTTPAPVNPCPSTRCPPRWNTIIRNGRCLCQPHFG